MRRICTTAAAIAITFLIAGCGMPFLPNPGDSSQTPATPGTAEGVVTGVTIRVPHVAPWLRALWSPGVSRARAIGVSDAVEVIVTQGGSEVLRRNVSHDDDLAETIECAIGLPAGSGYEITVNVFNEQVSPDDPVVSGTATGVTVLEGQRTALTITCTPTSPVSVDLGTPVAVNLVPFGTYGDPTGSEVWLQFTAPASGYLRVTPTITDIQQTAVGLFDTAGLIVDNQTIMDTITGNPTILLTGMDSGESYYLLVGVTASDQDLKSGTVLLEEFVPNYLDETDAPDPDLRSILEYYTGKEFTTSTNPNPVAPITDADLGALTGEIRTDGYNGGPVVTGITDLTGLEYCDGVQFVLLNGNDLSGPDANLDVLGQMDGLYALVAVSCNLQDLGFLSGIINLDQLKIWHNPGLDLADLLTVNASSFPGLTRFGFGAWDADGDDLVDPVSAADWQSILTMLAGHTALDDLILVDFSLDNGMLESLYTQVLSQDPSRWDKLSLAGGSFTETSAANLANLANLRELDLSTNPGLADISWITGLTELSGLRFAGTGITDITPLAALYDNGGFADRHWWAEDVDIRGCSSLDLSDGTANLSALEYLLGNGVRVAHDAVWTAEITVNFTYTGVGTVDGDHQIVLHLDETDHGFVVDTQHLSTATGTVTLTATMDQRQAYVEAAFDVDGSGYHTAWDPMRFYGETIDDRTPDPIDISAGPVTITFELDDTMRFNVDGGVQPIEIAGTYAGDVGYGAFTQVTDADSMTYYATYDDHSWDNGGYIWVYDNDAQYLIAQCTEYPNMPSAVGMFLLVGWTDEVWSGDVIAGYVSRTYSPQGEATGLFSHLEDAMASAADLATANELCSGTVTRQ
jgi:Leucine-rich repeat (LRR) protein